MTSPERPPAIRSLPWPPSSLSERAVPRIVRLRSWLLIFVTPSIIGQPAWLTLATATGERAAASSAAHSKPRDRGTPRRLGLEGHRRRARRVRAAVAGPVARHEAHGGVRFAQRPACRGRELHPERL